MKLRAYQSTGLTSIRESLREGSHAPLYVLPTGGGKTIVFSEVARGARAKGNRVLILVHRREILEQTLSKLWSFGITAGQIAPGMPQTHELVQVAMVQTLRNRLARIPRPDLIVIDEAHHALADNTWGKVLAYWRDVPRLGVTATPERLDGRGLGESFDTMIEGPSIHTLIADGWLSVPVIYRPPNEVVERFHVKRGDFDKTEQTEAMSRKTIVGDVIEHYREHLNGAPTVAFCVSVDHAKLMAEQFRQAGYRSEAIWGNMERRKRDAIIGGMRDGSMQVVCSCDVISEGVDVPAMAGAILLRRTMSLAVYLQQAGRALRVDPGKKRAVILDHVGNYYLHGHVLAERQWSLDSGKRDPRKEEPPTTTTCPKCYGVWPGRPRTCPSCGHSFTEAEAQERQVEFETIRERLIEAGAGEDDAASMAEFVRKTQEMEAAKRQKALLAKAFEYATEGEEGKRKLDQLRKMAGYKRGWVDWAWKHVRTKQRSA